MEVQELLNQQYASLLEQEGEYNFRKNAIAHLKATGLPTSKHEEWKYADFTNVLKKDYKIQAAELSHHDIQPLLIKELDGYLVVLVNGQFSKALSKLPEDSPELIIKNFADAKAQLGDKINQHADPANNPFSSLSAALATSGVYIEVPANSFVAKPIVVLNVTDKRSNATFSQPRNFVSVGKNAQVEIVEIHEGLGELESFTNAYTEIYADAESITNWYKLQLEESTASLIDTTQVFQATKSTFTCTTITLGGNMVRNNLHLVLNGEHCEGNMNGLYMLKGNTLVDNHTSVDHAQPNSQSNELYKGILDERSTGVFNGKIFVRKDAQKTNAYQSNKNLLISEDAVMNTKPQLEIWANDVKCSHGATIGKLDKDMLFYLQARGIGPKAAKAILMNAFAHDVLDKITLEPVRTFLDQLIVSRLGIEL